jgi:hypothetical protein
VESERLEWDDKKADANLRKHKVGFPEASTVLDGPYVTVEPDVGHAVTELRWLATGLSIRGQVLLVVFTMRGERARIISARKATWAERREYESQFGSWQG